MGAANAMRAYATYGSIVGDRALRALVYMALVSADGDAEPWFGLGAEALSELAFGRKVPSQDEDRKGREAALRMVGRVVEDLKEVGAIRLSEHARYGVHRATATRYRLYLDRPCPDGYVKSPHGNTTPPRRPSDRNRPKGSDGERLVDNPSPPDNPSDTDCPKGSDAGCREPGETFGQNLSDLRTDFVGPSDKICPTKEKEDYEERGFNSSPVVDGTVEGAHASVGRAADDLEVGHGSKRPPTARARAAERSRARPDAPLVPGIVSTTAEPDATGQDPRVDAKVVRSAAQAISEILCVAVDAAWARKVATDILAGRVVRHSPANYVRDSILRDPDPAGRFLPPPAAAEPLPWCGECDERTRFLLDENGFPSQTKCPTCGTPPARRAS